MQNERGSLSFYLFIARSVLFYRPVRTVTGLIARSVLFYRPVRTVTGLIFDEAGTFISVPTFIIHKAKYLTTENLHFFLLFNKFYKIL